MSRILVASSTFPQFPEDHRGAFLLRYWSQRANPSDVVRFLAPHTAWCAGDLELDVRRFRYAPRRWSTLSGRHGILENIRERRARALLVPAFLASLRRAVRQELQELGPDRVAAHWLLPAGWSVAAECAPLGIPYELFGHGTDVDVVIRMPRLLRRRIARWVKGASRVWLPSSEKRARLAEALGISVERLEVETMAEFVEAARAPRTPSAQASNEILYMGRLIPQKGVDDLLTAAAALETHPRVHLAGGGPERPRLERLARDLRLDAQFHGYVQGEAKAALFQRAAVLCVPSRELASGLSEGAPLVIAEALSYGLPVVATRVGGIPELCGDDPRVSLVPPNRIAALETALRHALAAG